MSSSVIRMPVTHAIKVCATNTGNGMHTFAEHLNVIFRNPHSFTTHKQCRRWQIQNWLEGGGLLELTEQGGLILGVNLFKPYHFALVVFVVANPLD